MRSRRPVSRAVQWLPGLIVAGGAAITTAHGLFEVALAARVPAGIAWLYPLITDGLALVAYTATARLTGGGARYAWAVVVLAAGLSGLAQAAYLASGATLDATPTLRFGVGAWPALAAAIAAHLLHLLTAEPAPTVHGPAVSDPPVQPRPSSVHPTPMDAGPRPDPHPGPRPIRRPGPRHARPPSTGGRPTSAAGDTPTRARARTVALRHAARHGVLPTVNALAAAADVSRGTAATVLQPLRHQASTAHPNISASQDGDRSR